MSQKPALCASARTCSTRHTSPPSCKSDVLPSQAHDASENATSQHSTNVTLSVSALLFAILQQSEKRERETAGPALCTSAGQCFTSERKASIMHIKRRILQQRKGQHHVHQLVRFSYQTQSQHHAPAWTTQYLSNRGCQLHMPPRRPASCASAGLCLTRSAKHNAHQPPVVLYSEHQLGLKWGFPKMGYPNIVS